MFDLRRQEAEPDIFSEDGSGISHNGTIKSVVWVGEHTGVTAGEDGLVKYAKFQVMVLVISAYMYFRWWDLRTRNLTTSLDFKNPITSMELSPQTNRLVVTSGRTVSFIPALPNNNQTHSLTLPYSPSSASIHPILQDRFVTGSLNDEWVRVHDLSGEERDVLKGHHGPVHCVEFSPDGEMFASGSGEFSITYYAGIELIQHLLSATVQRMVSYCVLLSFSLRDD